MDKKYIIKIVNEIQCKLDDIKNILKDSEENIVVDNIKDNNEESYLDILNKEIKRILSSGEGRPKNGKWTEETFRLLYLSIHIVKMKNMKTAKEIEDFCKPIANFLGLEPLSPEYEFERNDNKDTYYGILLDRKTRHFTDDRTRVGKVKEWKDRFYSDYRFLKEYYIKSSDSLFDIQYNKQCKKEGCYKFV